MIWLLDILATEVKTMTTKLFKSLLFSAAALSLSQHIFAQGQLSHPPSVPAGFLRLLDASKFVENYQASAVVSERVFGQRAQGSDKDYARFMGYIAKTDLASVKPCLASLTMKQGLSEAEAVEVAMIFESPIGLKVLQMSQELALQSIEQLRPLQPSFEGWSEEDKGRLTVIHQNVAFRKYSALSSNRAHAQGMFECYKGVLSVKYPDIKF